MVAALHEVDGLYKPLKRIQPFQHPNTKTLHNFLTKARNNFFTILGISRSYCGMLLVNENVTQRLTELSEYRRSQRLVQSLGVVNDLAESEVALIQEFNSSLRGDEEQNQYLLQVIEDDRKQFSTSTN